MLRTPRSTFNGHECKSDNPLCFYDHVQRSVGASDFCTVEISGFYRIIDPEHRSYEAIEVGEAREWTSPIRPVKRAILGVYKQWRVEGAKILFNKCTIKFNLSRTSKLYPCHSLRILRARMGSPNLLPDYYVDWHRIIFPTALADGSSIFSSIRHVEVDTCKAIIHSKGSHTEFFPEAGSREPSAGDINPHPTLQILRLQGPERSHRHY
jgi:hypothetical protein